MAKGSKEFRLSNEEVRFFRDTGYLRLAKPLEGEGLAKLTAAVRREIKRKLPPCRVNSLAEVSRIEQLLDRDTIFLETLKLPQIVQPLNSLLGPNVEVLKFRHNHATLNRKDDIPYRLHRDIQNWSRPLVSLFIFLEDATVQNGCTHVVPSSQFAPYLGKQSLDGGGNWADEHALSRRLAAQAVPLPMNKGGLLLLDSLAFHSVGPNHSNRSRLSIVFAFHSSDDLNHDLNDSSRILVSGSRKYKGTDVLEVSGSLKRLTDLR